MAFPNRPPPNAAMALGSSVPNPELAPSARKAKKQAPPPRAAKKAPGKKGKKKGRKAPPFRRAEGDEETAFR